MGHPPHFETTRHHKQSEAKRHNILRFAIFNHCLRWHITCCCLISCSKKKHGGGNGSNHEKQQTKAHSWLICNHLDLPNLQLWRNGYTVRWRPPGKTPKKLGSHGVHPSSLWWKLGGRPENMVKNGQESCSIHWHLCFFCLADLILARMYYVLTVWQQVSSQYSWKELPSSDSRNATQSTQSAYSNCSQHLTKNAKKASTIINVPWK